MKLALQIFSWVAVVLGILAIVGGITMINNDPTNAHDSILGGLLFLVQGVLALAYIDQQKNK